MDKAIEKARERSKVMNKEEETRRKYWDAVYKLNEVIDSGYESREDILEELENDLNENK